VSEMQRRLAAIYLRRAMIDQQDHTSTTGFAAQEAECRAAAARDGYEVGSVLQDVGSGGGQGHLSQREALRGLVARGEIDAVIVYSLDRLSRDTDYLDALWHEFDRADVRIITADQSSQDYLSPASLAFRAAMKTS